MNDNEAKNLIINVSHANTQNKIAKILKQYHLFMRIDVLIAEGFDSDYKTGYDDNLASDNRSHNFGNGKWSISGDNIPTTLTDAKYMVIQSLWSFLNISHNKFRYQIPPVSADVFINEIRQASSEKQIAQLVSSFHKNGSDNMLADYAINYNVNYSKNNKCFKDNNNNSIPLARIKKMAIKNINSIIHPKAILHY